MLNFNEFHNRTWADEKKRGLAVCVVKRKAENVCCDVLMLPSGLISELRVHFMLAKKQEAEQKFFTSDPTRNNRSLIMLNWLLSSDTHRGLTGSRLEALFRPVVKWQFSHMMQQTQFVWTDLALKHKMLSSGFLSVCLSTTLGSATPSGTAVNTTWSVTCSGWWPAGPSSSMCGTSLPWPYRYSSAQFSLRPTITMQWHNGRVSSFGHHYISFLWVCVTSRKVRMRLSLPTGSNLPSLIREDCWTWHGEVLWCWPQRCNVSYGAFCWSALTVGSFWMGMLLLVIRAGMEVWKGKKWRIHIKRSSRRCTAASLLDRMTPKKLVVKTQGKLVTLDFPTDPHLPAFTQRHVNWLNPIGVAWELHGLL